jgi:hypothetical protein
MMSLIVLMFFRESPLKIDDSVVAEGENAGEEVAGRPALYVVNQRD